MITILWVLYFVIWITCGKNQDYIRAMIPLMVAIIVVGFIVLGALLYFDTRTFLIVVMSTFVVDNKYKLLNK